jgi:hypothetical protein
MEMYCNSRNVGECTSFPANISSYWLIDGSCSDVNGCLIKDLNGNCRKGCKHSGSETSSSCVVDGCIQYSSSVCSTVSGCVFVEGFCVSSFEDFGCIGIDSPSICLSIPNCDIFFGGVCGERVLYNEDCGLVGEDVCFTASVCGWDPRVGCVKVEEEEEEAESQSFLSWSFFAFIGLINFDFFFFFFIYFNDFFFFISKFINISGCIIILNYAGCVCNNYLTFKKEERENRTK